MNGFHRNGETLPTIKMRCWVTVDWNSSPASCRFRRLSMSRRELRARFATSHETKSCTQKPRNICSRQCPFVLVEQAVRSFGCRTNFVFRSAKRLRKNFATIPGVRQFHPTRVTGGRKLWMNPFFAGRVAAIRTWWRRSFQSVARNVAAAGVTARKGNSFSSCTAADYYSVPAPTIPRTITRRIVITATATDMAESKRKPSIVRVIRVRHRPWAGSPHF
jgi:hypothetical protein